MEELQTRRMLADAHYHSGMLLKKLLETERSIEQLEKALEATKTCYGESSIQEATVADNLGMLHASKSDFVLAKKYYSSAYSAYEIAVGREDLRTSDCAFRLGSVLEALASNLALDFYKESLRVRRLHVAVGDERVAETLFYIARLLHMRDAHQDALACLEEVCEPTFECFSSVESLLINIARNTSQSLDIRKRLFDDCVVVAETYHNIGKVYNKMSQGEKALIFFRESLRINKKVRNEALYQVSLDMVSQIDCSYLFCDAMTTIDILHVGLTGAMCSIMYALSTCNRVLHRMLATDERTEQHTGRCTCHAKDRRNPAD